MKVAILYDGHAEAVTASPDVAAVLDSVAAVQGALARLDHDTVRVGAARDQAWLHTLRALRPDVVFNLCEGIEGDSAAEAEVAAALASAGLCFTGASAGALRLARRKDRVNALLGGAVPVPAWSLADDATRAAWRSYPAIVKPAGEDAGIGITREAVVRGEGELARALDAAAGLGPLLVQQFLDGVELIVGFVGSVSLPVAEVDYTAMPQGLPHVVGYAAKWESGSHEDLGTHTRCPARIERGLEQQAIETARAAWRAICNRGYARVDLRGDDREVLHVLDVNPNPDLAPDAGLARMAAAAGWSYTDLIDRIVRDAVGAAVPLR